MENVSSVRFFSRPLSQIQQSKVQIENAGKSLKFSSEIYQNNNFQSASKSSKSSNINNFQSVSKFSTSQKSPHFQRTLKEDLNNEKARNETSELKFSKQKIAEKTDFIEQELAKVSQEKKNLENYCASLEKELAQAKEKIANAATYQSTITELENLRNSYNESLKKYEILKNNYDLSQKKEVFLREDIDKKELLLQSYENKIAAFQAEIKNLNDSLAEKENYIFELKSIKPNSVKREREKIAALENKDNEARLLQRVNEQNQEINRLMETIREMGIREKKWDEVKRAMRGQEIELSQLREENYNYENLVKRLRKELEEKNDEIRKMQDLDEKTLVEKIQDNKFQIYELQRKLKQSEIENSHFSQILDGYHRNVPSYSYKS